jgi:hypothetical protein
LQKFYCTNCAVEFESHAHKSEQISSINFISDVDKRWKALIGLYADLNSAAREKVKPFLNLVAYLDDISKESTGLKPTESIHADYAAVSLNYNQLQKHLESLEELLKKRKVEEFRVFDESFKTYDEALPKFAYLKTVTETFIFTAYNTVLLHDTEKYFPKDMTQENREMYYRLKFRALNSARVTDTQNYYKSVPLLLELQIESTELAFKAITKNSMGAEAQFNKSLQLLEKI